MEVRGPIVLWFVLRPCGHPNMPAARPPPLRRRIVYKSRGDTFAQVIICNNKKSFVEHLYLHSLGTPTVLTSPMSVILEADDRVSFMK